MDDEWMAEGELSQTIPRRRSSPATASASTSPARSAAECPVQAACLEYALDNRIDHGVWGGCSERERRRILKRRRKPRWPRCLTTAARLDDAGRRAPDLYRRMAQSRPRQAAVEGQSAVPVSAGSADGTVDAVRRFSSSSVPFLNSCCASPSERASFGSLRHRRAPGRSRG